jgi:hypothetical protein
MRTRMGTLLKSWKVALLLTVLSFGIGYGIRLLTHTAAKAYAQTGITPFTATLLTKQYDARGMELASFSTLVAKRRSGSTSTIREGFRNNETSKFTSIRLVEEMKEVSGFNGVKSKFTTKLSRERAEQLAAPGDRDCTSVPGTLHPAQDPQTILGFTVVRKVLSQDRPGGKTTITESWLAPELGCLVMRKTHGVMETSGTVLNFESVEAAHVMVGEPDAALFSIPDDFVERTPSEAYAAEAARLGDADCKKCPQEVLANSNALYLKNKY